MPNRSYRPANWLSSGEAEALRDDTADVLTLCGSSFYVVCFPFARLSTFARNPVAPTVGKKRVKIRLIWLGASLGSMACARLPSRFLTVLAFR
jgi:hypothetical protein